MSTNGNGHSGELREQLRDLAQNDLARSLFHVVLEHLEGARRLRTPREPLRRAAEATEIGLLQLSGNTETTEQLAERFSCSTATIKRRRRELREALARVPMAPRAGTRT